MLVDINTSSSVNGAATTNQIVVRRTIEGLADINDPTTGLAIWERQIPPAVRRWLLQLENARLPSGRVLCKRQHIERAVSSFFEKCKVTDEESTRLLAEDIDRLANLYADIVLCDQVDIRLEAIQHDGCWKFHLDQVAMRLVTTYMGAGTQYVVPDFSEQALREQQSYAGPIENFPEHAVALFKGAHNRPGTGIVHRSPPARSFAGTRLFLCINSPSNASLELWRPSQ